MLKEIVGMGEIWRYSWAFDSARCHGVMRRCGDPQGGPRSFVSRHYTLPTRRRRCQ
jgi:hypothetical protein